jgi:hypothetical protein
VELKLITEEGTLVRNAVIVLEYKGTLSIGDLFNIVVIDNYRINYTNIWSREKILRNKKTHKIIWQCSDRIGVE